ncbi:MAG: hypothetical protein ABEJ22_06840 [Haloferacaceae archaeon]
MIDNAHRSDDGGRHDETTARKTEAFVLPVDVAPDPDVRAKLEEREDCPDELTMYPADAEGYDLMTTWITAREGSFVSLSAMR